MVENRNTWAYTQYVRDQRYFELQNNAKYKQLGLWSLSQDQTIAPWEWRKSKNSASGQQGAKTVSKRVYS